MIDHPVDALESCALGDLEPAQADAVFAHADGCPSCAAMLAVAMQGVNALAAADGERAGVARVARVPRGRPTWGLLGVTAAAALALAVWNVDLRANDHPAPVDVLVHSHFTHHPLVGHGGAAKLILALDGSWLYVVADGLRPWSVYTLKVDGTMVGSLRADAAGTATAYFTRAAGAVRSAELDGPDGARLGWRDR